MWGSSLLSSPGAEAPWGLNWTDLHFAPLPPVHEELWDFLLCPVEC